jgi:menaquinone-dependent protoporphyrinogen oxidase
VLEGENNMSASILVTYASRYGSTEEVAKIVVETLREHGIEADLLRAREVQTLEGYSSVVIGAPLYIGQWHKDAQNFLTRHRDALTQRQVVIFTLGPIGQDETEWEGVRTQLEQQLAKYPWLKPMAQELFAGRYDPALLRFPDSLLAKLPVSPLHHMPARDTRDWAAIHAWVGSLVPKLQPVATH